MYNLTMMSEFDTLSVIIIFDVSLKEHMIQLGHGNKSLGNAVPCKIVRCCLFVSIIIFHFHSA